ncbi:Predicted signal-transduction protein containing cAMP-binding and CBS domains [Rubrivivax sp. A210]|uniref:putative nucleotidyltransferase substrate binding domain-containing protein n=1 Tax=Rubrivivax sp. A210 TaxID=2772301 RepID=UPI0019A0B990|nr:putative nucleotidyltransferase substrate binding domain-containing protein [Rubrivivax sp. A210]CAD5374112.1 Predicted signal-transduction protein containing cAMP-binding and CBS domains [Rubrivivax sp. A210]
MTPSAAEPQREMLTLVTARIRDAYLRKPYYVDGATDLVSVCRELSAHGLTHALVRDGSRLGIFTTTDLRDALLREQPPQQLAVREVARFDLVAVQADADLFEALWLMVSHRVHRLVVRDGEAMDAPVIGVLGQLDLVSFVANHSHIVALQIDDAASVDDLGDAARRVDEMVKLLHGSGIRIERITRLVSELNTRLFARLWTLLAPSELRANSCLLVMGSEGRGEQILKTDQDNALLLRDGFEWPGLQELCARFSAALQALGYPPCPGDIMITNPLWCQPLARFQETQRSWIYGGGAGGGGSADGPMHLAIFFDAACVAGDPDLLLEARAHLDRILAGNDLFFARFARAADQFQEPGNWFTRLTRSRDEQPLDLKKLGTFPIVHGVRALALQYGVREQGTAARLARLQEAQHIDAPLAGDLLQALRLLMGIRLTHQLAQREQGLAPGNEVRASDLSTLEREPLHDALAIVKRFRQFLRQHFRFDAL